MTFRLADKYGRHVEIQLRISKKKLAVGFSVLTFQMDSKQYTCRVTWSAEDNESVGLCAEFPSLSWLDADQSKAFSGIEELVADVVADMISNNEKVPTPLSGKI